MVMENPNENRRYFNNGQETIIRECPHLLKEVEQVISRVEAQKVKQRCIPGNGLHQGKTRERSLW